MPSTKIRIEAGVETAGDGQELQERTLSKSEKAKLATLTLLGHQAIATGKSILNYSISNIGSFTGDYTKTEQIQYALGMVGDIASIGVAFATNPIAGVIAIGGVALNRSLEAVSYFQDQKHKEIENNYLLERSGNALTNGSRGTED